ncbi:MAG: hypothetical protein OXE46_02490 [Chloroflexi bacterium]|nr:hypothetical protein [Chloroflexota bacterium]
MEREDRRSPALQLTQRQRWSLPLSYLVIAVGLLAGIVQRDNLLNQASVYMNDEAGITAVHPARWLLEESGDFVFRVRDMSYPGFQTLIEVSTVAVGADNSARSIFDQLSLARAQALVDYHILGYDEYVLSDESMASSMAYSFVARDASPFLQGISTVVSGLDILLVRRGQGVIVSFRADSRIFEREVSTLRWFIENLEF